MNVTCATDSYDCTQITQIEKHTCVSTVNSRLSGRPTGKWVLMDVTKENGKLTFTIGRIGPSCITWGD